MLRKMLLAVVVGTVAAGAAGAAERDSLCAPGAHRAPGPQGADVAAICEHGRRWIKAFAAGDIDALMALYAADAQVALHGHPRLNGREAVRAYFAPALAAHPKLSFLLDVDDIQVSGNVAWLVSRYWFTTQLADGHSVEDAGRSALIYRRERGPGHRSEWKIALDIDQATPDAAFPAPATAH